MKLNLEAKTPAEQKVKAYLEQNASEVLAHKINEGVRIVKDGKTLMNKKTLSGFLKFACDEAKKQAEKGAQSACIDDAVVYGWAVHYFEEDSIEGTLCNEDGTEYTAPMSKAASLPTKYEPPKPTPQPQMSLFDMLPAKQETQPPVIDEPDDEPTDEDYAEAEEAVQTSPPPPAQPQGSPVWQRYVDPETGEVIDELSEEEMRQFDGNIDETLPTVSKILAGNPPTTRSDEALAKEIASVIDDTPVTSTKNTASMPKDEDEPDISAFDMDALCILSELFGNELELR